MRFTNTHSVQYWYWYQTISPWYNIFHLIFDRWTCNRLNSYYTYHPEEVMKYSCTLQSFGKAQGEDWSWFTLSPCSHSICIDCFARLSAERGCNSYFQCPVCKADTREWQVAHIKETTMLENLQVGRQTGQSGAIMMV